MPLLVKVRFVNNSGNLSPKTYEYKTRAYMPWGITRHYFNIETSDGNNYRNSKVVITDFSPIDFIKSKDFENLPLKTQVFEFFMMSLRTLDGVNLSELKKRFSYLITEKILNLFDRWISLKNARKYFKDGNEFFALTEQGLLFENKFLEEFLEVF